MLVTEDFHMSEAYKNAGVDIEAGYEAVSKIKKHVDRTKRLGVLGALGGFGGLFDLSALPYKEPVLVTGTDGVGTKLLIAQMMNKHDTIGIDAVAMCVNDIVVQGAEPLFFLDYIACGKSDPNMIEAIVKGVADGCELAGCAIVGGETAEMPGMYNEDEYDIAGFVVGACEKSNLIDGRSIKSGDVLIGLPSSGIHSNGYSLVRKVLLSDAQLSLNTYVDSLGCTIGEELLKPTKIYVEPVRHVIAQAEIKGMAHITGGGFFENIPRALPDGYKAVIKEGTWDIPPIFQLLQDKGSLTDKDLFNVFNMGIGFVLIVSKADAEKVLKLLHEKNEQATIIGYVDKGNGVELLR